MTQLDDFGRAYLTMTLEINKHIDGYVDAYYGPEALKAEVEATPKKAPAELLDDLARLRDMLPTEDPAREAYLTAVFRAMDCTLRMLDGEEFDYLDEVNRLFDISPELVPESTFEEAHAELDALIIAKGTIAERLERWRKQFDIPSDKLLHILGIARDETRKRTAQFIDLVEGEGIELTLVNNQPWSAYNWFKGNAQSLIEFNIDIPVSALAVMHLFAHEGYPGHHTEHQLKEQHLCKEKGYAEYASALLHSPSAVIAEGIAETGMDLIFKDKRDAIDWTVDVILVQAGLPPALPADIERIDAAREKLQAVSRNAAIKYHRGELNEEQVLDYLLTYGLANEKRAKQIFSFMSNPLFRAYIFTYTQGYDLISRAVDEEGKRDLFMRLLLEPVLPSELAAMAAS